MNMQTNKPRLSAMLSQVASVAVLRSSSLGITRLDKRASKEIDRAKHALSGTGRVTASRIAGAEARVQEMNKITSEARATLAAMTTAWGEGQRLLSNQMLKAWLEQFAPLQDKYKSLRAAFIADAPMIIADAEQNKGDYDVKPPTLEEIQSAFSLEFDIVQIPDSESFHGAGVSAELEKEMRRHFEASIEAAYSRATRDAFVRVAKPLSNLIDRLTEYTKVEAEKSRGLDIRMTPLYETVITNITDIGSMFGQFNLTNDPIMADITKALKAFEGVDVDDLKRDKGLRDDLTTKAAAILDNIKDLI